MTEIVFLVKESLEGGFEAKALSASTYTEADTLDESKVMICNAISCYFGEDEHSKLICLHYKREEIIAA